MVYAPILVAVCGDVTRFASRREKTDVSEVPLARAEHCARPL